MRTAFFASLATTLLLALVLPHPAAAVWPPTGRALCTESHQQFTPVVTTDDAGGAIVAWTDLRLLGVVANIYVQHVGPAGKVDPRWPSDGQALCINPVAQDAPTIVSDGAGGAIVTWEDDRDFNGIHIYAQRVLGAGAVDPAWPDSALRLSNGYGNQGAAASVSDGAGGAIVVWQDLRNLGVYDLYAQHVLSSGVVDNRWPPLASAVCTATDHQIFPAIVSDDAGGAIVTWDDNRNGMNYDIYAQHVLENGVMDGSWPSDGLAICTADGYQLNPTLVSDGSGGAIITWHDNRSGGNHIYAQHVLITGAVDAAWPAGGLAVCTFDDDQEFPVIVADGLHGAIITWQDWRSGTHTNIFAQHVLASGSVDPAWPADGTALSTAHRQELHPTIASDGAAGAFITWMDSIAGEDDVYAHHVMASGVVDPFFPVDGLVVCAQASEQQFPTIVAGGAGAAVVAWQDSRSGNFDIYARKIGHRWRVIGTPPPGTISLARPSPNPAVGPVDLRFALSHAERVTLTIYDVGGRCVRQILSDDEPAGEHAIAWDLRDEAGRAVPAGIYFERLEAADGVLTEKVVTLR